ncbi:hypothetical protein ACFE04_000573 [Oxalis oulophora]
MGSLEKFSFKGNKSPTCLRGLRTKIVDQLRDLAAEAGGKSSDKKDLYNQHNLFRDIVTDFLLEVVYSPETSAEIGGDKSLGTSTWSELENEFLDDIFGFTPKKKNDHNSSNAKRMYKSRLSIQNKVRRQFLIKQRLMVAGRNVGYFAAADG